jgi:hypothetical protein
LRGGTGGPHLWPLSAELCLPGGPGNDGIRMRRGDGVQDLDDVGILHLPEHLQEVCLLRRRPETVQHLDKLIWTALHQEDNRLVGYHPGQVLVCRLPRIVTPLPASQAATYGPRRG